MIALPDGYTSQYQELGYLSLPGAVQLKDLDSLIAAVDSLTDHPLAFKTITDGEFRYVKNVQVIGVQLQSILTEIGVAAVARTLLNGEPCLERDEFVVKRRNASDVMPWHQDSVYWHHDPLITLVIQTADCPAGDGVLQVGTASHRAGKLAHVQSEYGLAVEKAPDERNTTILGGPRGTIFVIHPHLVHRGYSGRALIPTYTLVYSRAQ